jgi:hypothetical protein
MRASWLSLTRSLAPQFTEIIKNNSIMKQKKKYGRPVMRVVELQYQSRILVGSDPVGSKASINDWDDGDTTDEEIYM